MWGRLGNLNSKLKELAVDMVAPRGGRASDDGSDDGGSDGDLPRRRQPTRRLSNPPSGSEGPSTPVLRAAEPGASLPRQRHAPTTAPGANPSSRPFGGASQDAGGGGAFVDERRDLLERIAALQGEVAARHAACSDLQQQLDDERRRHGTRGSGRKSPADDVVQQLAQLEREKAQVVRQAQQYALDVQKSHEETVSYYEHKIQVLQEQMHQQAAAARAEADTLQRRLSDAVAEAQVRQRTLEEEKAQLRATVQQLTGSSMELARRKSSDAAAEEQHTGARLHAADAVDRGEPPADITASRVLLEWEAKLAAQNKAFEEASLQWQAALQLRDAELAAQSERLSALQSQVAEATAQANEAQRIRVGEKSRHEEAILRLTQELAASDAAREALEREKGLLRAEVQSLRSSVEAQAVAEVDRGGEATRLRGQLDEIRTALQLSERNEAQVRQQLAAALQELESAKRTKEIESNMRAHEAQMLATLRATHDELEQENRRLRTVQQSVLEGCQTMLAHAPIASPRSAAVAVGGLAELISLVSQEMARLQQGLAEGQHMQAQWEMTYAQAKEVNAAMQAQLRDAQRQMQECRADVAAKEKIIAGLQQRLKDDAARWQETQESLSTRDHSNRRAAEEREQLEAQVAQLRKQLAAADERCAALSADVEGLRNAQQDKDDELALAQRSTANLQMVLEQFQATRRRDVEEKTMYLQHEADVLRAELASVESMKQRHKDELESLTKAHRKELASKSVALSSLQSKLVEMKRALEETASLLSEEHTIDKRVVSHLVVNFVSSVAEHRGDEEDILKVMAGLLNWDETMQQRAGLLPGPLNPKKLLPRSFVGGLVKSVWGGAASRIREGNAFNGDSGAAASGQRSLAEMWVEFLVKEGEEARVHRSGEAKSGETEEDTRSSLTRGRGEMAAD